MDQLFAFKRGKAIFRFYLINDYDLTFTIEGDPDITPRELASYLKSKDIDNKHLDVKKIEEALYKAMSGGAVDENILIDISSTIHPETEISFESDKRPVPVQKNDLIAAIAVHRKKEKPDDMFGKPIITMGLSEETSYNFRNIIYKRKEGKLIASISGMLIEHDNYIAVYREIEIIFPDHKLEALCRICTSRKISENEIASALFEAGVTFGVDEKAITSLIAEIENKIEMEGFVFIESCILAKGKSAVPPKDAYIDWKIDVQDKIQFVEDAHGNINFKQANIIKTVKKGQVLARLHKPVEGVAGMGIDQQAIPVEPPRSIKLKNGKGVLVKDETIFFAETEGQVVYKKGILTVNPVLDIKGDVDYSTGKITFDGSVRVGKDILPGFPVEVTQSVSVSGIVDGSQVKTGNDLDVKGGISGKEKANIFSAGNITAKYISESEIYALGNVIVDNSIIDSRLRVMSSVIASNSGIVGGKLIVNRGIVCKQLGSQMEVKTDILIGNSDPEEQKKFEHLRDELLSSECLVKAIGKDIENAKAAGEYFDIEILTSELKFARKRLDLIRAKVDKETYGKPELITPVYKIAILEALYPGVVIEMKGHKKKINQLAKGPLLVFFNDGIKEIDMRFLSSEEIINLKKQFSSWLEDASY